MQRVSVRRAMTAQRSRYCTFVACLKPVLDEEMGCFEEVAQLEDVLAKLGKVRAEKEKIGRAQTFESAFPLR